MTEPTATNPVEGSEELSETGVAEPLVVAGENLDLEPQLDEDGNPVVPELTEEELEEIEHDGKKAKIPAWLKPAIMMNADYTKKTQDHASNVRAWEQQRDQQTQANEEQLQLRGLSKVIDGKLAEYAKVDWQTWRASNPQQAADAQFDYQQLQNAKRDLDTSISDADRTASEAQRAQHATRLQEGHAVLAKEIPGWGKPEVTAELVAAGKKYGFTDQELSQITDPRMIKALWDAQSNAKTATQKQQTERIAAGQKTTPVQTARGASGKFTVGADTSDFAAFEKLADSKLKKRA